MCASLKQEDKTDVKLNDYSSLCRSPLASALRSGYRERERDIRERERSDSRDRDDHYGRPGYERVPYERTGPDRSGPERYGHSSSPYGICHRHYSLPCVLLKRSAHK